MNKSVFSSLFFSSLQSTNKVFKIIMKRKKKRFMDNEITYVNSLLIINMNSFLISFVKSVYDRQKANITQK